MINLQKFCSTDEMRRHLGKPFSKGEWTYATNGHIAIRVPRIEDVEEYPETPDCEKLFDEADKRDPHEWVGIPAIKISRLPCDCCLDCDGFIEPCERVKFTTKSGVEIFLANVYLRDIVEELLTQEIGITDNRVAPVKIRFLGGQGLLMPMRS